MTAEHYYPAPTGLPPMGGSTDDEEEAFLAETRRREKIAIKVRDMHIDREARQRFAAEVLVTEGIAPFDAGMLGEILSRPQDPPHRAEGLIPYEAGTLLVAQRKTGKTTTQLNLARSLIVGDEFLGRFPTRQITGNVAFLNFEVSAQTLARWAHEHDIPHDRFFLVNLRGRRNPLANDGDRDALATKLRHLDVESLFVDPFGRAFTGSNQNDSGEVGSWLADLDRFARGDVGAKDLILAAHAGWNGERTRGSTALEDWADSIITLTRDDTQRLRYLRAEGRDIDVAEDELVYDEATRRLTLAGSGSRRAATKTRQAQALVPVVIDLLREVPHLSGNQLDTRIKALITSGDLDAAHSKGDGARAAQLLERKDIVISRDGPRGARLFSLVTSPTSPDFPEGRVATSPTSLYGRGGHQGTEDPALPLGEVTTTADIAPRMDERP